MQRLHVYHEYKALKISVNTISIYRNKFMPFFGEPIQYIEMAFPLP